MQHIETIELGSSQSSITFSSIPQDYDDLILVHSLRSNRSSANDFVGLKVNGNESNLSFITLFANNSSIFTGSVTGRIEFGYSTADTAVTNTFANNQCYISGYTLANAKSMSINGVTEDNSTGAVTAIVAGLWNDTSAITSLEMYPFAGGTAWLAGSTASLYGVTSGGSGTVTTA